MRSSIKRNNLLTMPACAGIMALSGPILVALYGDSRQITSTVLIILGAASFFVCLQHITLAILQANGHEKLAMLTFPIGAVFRIVFSFVLVGNPNIGILGSPVGTLACFMVMSALNIIFIFVKVRARDKIGSTFTKPLFCTAIMAVAAYFTYKALHLAGSGIIGTGRMAVCLYLGGAIVVGVVVYVVLIVVTRTLTVNDLKLVPKGDKLAKLLRIK
jgi:stage V sporulation protein B